MNQEQKWNPDGFVETVIHRVSNKNETGYAAVMRRADNPNQCSAAWEYLIPFCDIAEERGRLCFALVGAAIARAKPEADGAADVGTALRGICKGDKDAEEREARRLRRILNCSTAEDLIPVLRPILAYVQGKSNVSLCFRRLLKDLLYWNEDVRIRWAKQFYGKENEPSESGEVQ